MIKTKYFVLIVIMILFQGCGTNANISGKYVNKNDTNITNYLQLNPDNTYIHFYKKNNISLSQKGNWELRKDPYFGIDLYQFCDYNEKGENYIKFAIYTLIIDGNNLNTGFDGKNNSSFEKE